MSNEERWISVGDVAISRPGAYPATLQIYDHPDRNV